MPRFPHITFILIMSIFAMTSAAESDVQAVSAGNNKFTNKVYTEISKPNENLIFSPVSLHTILSLLYQGSAGATEEALKRVLHVPNKARTSLGFQHIMSELNNVKDVSLEIANRIFVKSGLNLKKQFKDIATKQFFAGAENVDFDKKVDAAKKINSWVEAKTNSKIINLISPEFLGDDSVMVLVNAIYFKGRWLKEFNKHLTRMKKFYTSGTGSVTCWMMHRTGFYDYKEDKELNAQIVQIPYKNNDFSMVIVLPRQRTGLADLEKKLATYDLTKLIKDLDDTKLELSLPKFKIESTIDLNEPLRKLGLANAFGPSANFNQLLEYGPIWISQVIQKAFIEVNEEGAEAAAATAVGAVAASISLSPPLPPKQFIADHPFVFFLINKGNVAKILFNGKIEKVKPVLNF